LCGAGPQKVGVVYIPALLNYYNNTPTISWKKNQDSGARREAEDMAEDTNGFASLARRRCVKPIIAAVNGIAMGGGVEIILNCDLVVASRDAKLGLPEVKRGVVAGAGGEFIYDGELCFGNDLVI
jgi:enoyl-CoA hydratase/carnithine racemase